MKRLASVLVAGLAAVCASAAAAAPPLPPGYHTCGKVAGPTITQPWRGGKLTAMHDYGVGATSVTCSFARRWVTEIVHESTPDRPLQHPAGPPSWRCTAGSVTRHVAASGFCHDATNTKGMSWGAEP